LRFWAGGKLSLTGDRLWHSVDLQFVAAR